jgi:hypothetical protein
MQRIAEWWELPKETTQWNISKISYGTPMLPISLAKHPVEGFA